MSGYPRNKFGYTRCRDPISLLRIKTLKRSISSSYPSFKSPASKMLNNQITLRERPVNDIDPRLNGDGTFQRNSSQISEELKSGEALIKIEYVSVSTYQELVQHLLDSR